MKQRAFVQLGGNQPNTPYWFGRTHAAARLWSANGTIRQSSWYQSPAWGYASPFPFLNQVIEFPCLLKPEALLAHMRSLETLSGKPQKAETYLDRCLDLDLLFIGETIVQKKELQVPHPRLHLRNFVLIPLNELAPDLTHPVLKRTVRELNQSSPDLAKVEAWMRV